MRCQCIICQELFENATEQVISALECGHTFHDNCLQQWLQNGSTCPSCRIQVNRRRIIPRLYFDAPEEEDEVDSGKLQNDLDRLRLEVRKNDKEKSDIVKEKDLINERLDEAKSANKRIEKLFKAEQSANSSLRTTLKYHEAQQQSLNLEREECKRIKKKLVELQRIETLLNGTETDAADVISLTGEGSSAVQALSRQAAFLKREFEKAKSEKRLLREHLDKIQLAENRKSNKAEDLAKECKLLKIQLQRSEEDLKDKEKENDVQKKRISRLKRVINSPHTGAASSSFMEILLDDSLQKTSTPRIDMPKNSDLVDLNVTPDLFTSPENTRIKPQKSVCDRNITNISKKRTLPDCDREQENMETKFIKISSASEKCSQPGKRLKCDTDSMNSISSIASMNIFRKKGLSVTDPNSVTRKGYDGLGGHTTHVNPKGNFNMFKKPAARKPVLSKSTKVPMLPTMDGFIEIE